MLTFDDCDNEDLQDLDAEDVAHRVIDLWLATPLYVQQWLEDQRPDHVRPHDPVPVDATWLIPLDGDHHKLLKEQPTWVLEGLVWNGSDEQVKAAALLIRERYSVDQWPLAVQVAEEAINEEKAKRWGPNWRELESMSIHRETQDAIRASRHY